MRTTVPPHETPYRDRFDPEAWTAALAGDDATPASPLFRRGLELARDICRASRRAGELWLDVGCGPGHLAHELAAHGTRILGIDHDAAMLRFARRRLAADAPAIVERGAELVLASADRIPIRAGRADGILAVSLMGCFADPMPFLREARRVLREQGTLVVTITNGSSVLRRAEHAVRAVLPRTRPATGERIRPYAAREMRHALESVGFAVAVVHGYGFHLQMGTRVVPRAALSRALERGARWAVSRSIARNLLFVARAR